METTDIDGVLQSFENFLRNPHVVHATASALLGAAVGLFARIILKIILLYLASVMILLVILQSFNVISIHVNPEEINNLLVHFVNFLQRFELQDQTFFLSGIIFGFKYGFLSRLKK